MSPSESTDEHHESGTDLDVYVGGERVEMLYLSPGDSFEMEVWPDEDSSAVDVRIEVPEDE